jgi:probable HAF family extracellular repeat protein
MNPPKTLLMAALGLIVSALSAQAAQIFPPVPNYTLAVIPLLSGGTINDTYANAINVEGDVVGTSGGHAFLYKRGKLIDIGALFPASVSGSSAVGVNAFDEVIGTYNQYVVVSGITYQELAGSFIYREGRVELLPNPTGAVTNVVAINDIGQIVGNYDTTVGFYTTTSPWLRQVNGAFVPLPLFNGKVVYPGAINNLGQIAASGSGPSSSTFTLIVDDGSYSVCMPHVLLITGQHVQDLMTSIVPTTYLNVSASSVNDFGAVAGNTELANFLGDDQPQHASLFFAGQVTDFGGLQGPQAVNYFDYYSEGEFYGRSYLEGINDFGTMVGGEADYFGIDDPVGITVVNGVVYNLNSYVPNPVINGVKLGITLGVAINNAGQILAWASDITGIGSGIAGYIYPAYMVVMTPIRVKAIRP